MGFGHFQDHLFIVVPGIQINVLFLAWRNLRFLKGSNIVCKSRKIIFKFLHPFGRSPAINCSTFWLYKSKCDSIESQKLLNEITFLADLPDFFPGCLFNYASGINFFSIMSFFDQYERDGYIHCVYCSDWIVEWNFFFWFNRLTFVFLTIG